MSASPKKRTTFLGLLFETFKTVSLAVIIAFVLRTLLFQPFHIPSGSMEPTLIKGDYLITTKYSLGYGKFAATPFVLPVTEGRILERFPKRGDIIVFKPTGSKIYLIKRLIGLPGDQVQMLDVQLHLNGTKQELTKIADDTHTSAAGNLIRASKYKETLADSRKSHIVFDKQIGSAADNTPVFTVPERHYFFLGDNRDHSADSRLPVELGGVGFVPASNLVGRAEFVLLSVNDEFKLTQPWTWINFRGDRMFKGLR